MIPHGGVKPSKIRALRRSKKIEAPILAEAVGISASYLGMIERGTRVPTDEVLQQIAGRLGVRVEQLMEAGPTVAEKQMSDQLRAQRELINPAAAFGKQLKALRAKHNVSVRQLCERRGGEGDDVLKAWLVREFEIGSRVPTEAEMAKLAQAFEFGDVGSFREALGDAGDDMIFSESRAARRLAYDRDASDWPELVLRATSRGFTGDQLVIDGDQLPDGSEHITRGARILVDRSVRVSEGDPVICLDRKDVLGFGRVENGVVKDAEGRELKGSIWRVVALLYP